MAKDKNKKLKGSVWKRILGKFETIALKNRKISKYLGVFALVFALLSLTIALGSLLSTQQQTSFAGLVCPAGTTAQGSNCVYSATANNNYTCPNGGTLSGSTCSYPASQNNAGSYTCPNGGALVGTQCQYNATVSSATPICPYGGLSQSNAYQEGGQNVTLCYYEANCVATSNGSCTAWAQCPQDSTFAWSDSFAGASINSSICSHSAFPATTALYCPNGGYLSAGVCRFQANCVATSFGSCTGWQQCPQGWSATSGGNCTRIAVATPSQYLVSTCPNGGTLSGTTCTYNATATTTYTCPNGGTLSGTTCTYAATNAPTYSCPNGGTLNGTNCLVTPTSYQIDSSSVGTGTCTPSTLYNSGTTNTTATCTYPLTGAPAGVSYTLPSGGITASISTATGNSSPCTVSGSTLTCTNVPATNATAGTQNATTTAGGTAPVTVSAIPATTITQANTGNGTCTPASVVIGSTTTCSFPLTGDNNNNYALPSGGITASITTATGNSSACTITGNGTAQAALSCTSVPTTNGTAGNQTAKPNLSGETSTAPVALTNAPYTIDLSNIGNSTDCTSTKNVTIGQTYTCTFPITTPANTTPVLPTSQSFTATTSQNGGTDVTPVSGGYSPACTLSQSGTDLVCAGIPSTGGTAGVRNVPLRLGTTAPVDKGDVNLMVAPTTIALTNIGNSTDCTSTKTVAIPQTYVCNFPLTGNSGNNYALPSEGITAATSQNGGTDVTPLSSGYSPACTITGNGTAQVALTCSTIPTLGGTAGGRNVIVRIGTTAPADKGDVTLTLDATPTVIGSNNIGNSSNCTASLTVTIGQTYTCTFPLTGGNGNNYALPNGGITATTQTANGQSPACTITGNGTAQAALVCSGIPTTGASAGNKNVLLKIGTSDPVAKGIVNLLAPSTLVRTGGINGMVLGASLLLIAGIGYGYWSTTKQRSLKLK